MSEIRHAASAVLFAALVSGPAMAAEPAKPSNHGYVGVGLQLESQSISTPLGDGNTTGGGLILNGAGVLPLNDGVGFGLTGSMGFSSRTDSDTDETVSSGQFGFDGGVVLMDMFYLSLGIQVLNQTPDSTDVVTTYTVVPFGIGMLKGTDTGYLLAQLRFGAGEVSNDLTSDTADLGFFGLRLAGQTGTSGGLQFMGGFEFDAYDISDFDTTDNLFRFFVGLGFGK